MILNSIAAAFFVAGLVAAWFTIVRPVWRSWDFYLGRIKGYTIGQCLRGFRTRIVSWLIMISSALVAAYDFLAPIAAGVDWTPVTARVPNWVWPFVLFGVAALFRYLRKITTGPESK